MAPGSFPAVVRLRAAEIRERRRELAALLIDAVESGASVGFLAGLDWETACAYWDQVAEAARWERTYVLALIENDHLIGTAQLLPAASQNAAHRAEVAKVLVLRECRGRGLGRALMTEVEAAARRLGFSLLVLDTQTGSPAQRLYESMDYVVAGIIPDYARLPNRALAPTTYLYKPLR